MDTELRNKLEWWSSNTSEEIEIDRICNVYIDSFDSFIFIKVQ
jgi:hypothetical protein